MSTDRLTPRQQQILDVIDQHLTERGYPPSVREIGQAVGLTSPSSVQNHLNRLNELGYLRRDPSKPRAMEVRYDPNSGASGERRPFRHVPLVGDVLAEENVTEIVPVPTDLCGDGDLFMLRVRGDSMIDVGIFDGDLIVARAGAHVNKGDIVVAGIPGDEATVKTWSRDGETIVLTPANPRLSPMEFHASEVTVYGRVVTVMRKL